MGSSACICWDSGPSSVSVHSDLAGVSVPPSSSGPGGSSGIIWASGLYLDPSVCSLWGVDFCLGSCGLLWIWVLAPTSQWSAGMWSSAGLLLRIGCLAPHHTVASLGACHGAEGDSGEGACLQPPLFLTWSCFQQILHHPSPSRRGARTPSFAQSL